MRATPLIGHDVSQRTRVRQKTENANPVTLESLASRVCRGDASLTSSELQASSYLSLVHYLKEEGDGYSGNGVLTAALCIFLWTCVIAKETEAIWNDAFAVYGAWLSNPAAADGSDAALVCLVALGVAERLGSGGR